MEVKAYGDIVRKERLLNGLTQRDFSLKHKIPYGRLVKLESLK